MWYDGAPHQGQCEGCTTTAWHLKDAAYLNARGVSFAILTTGRPDEVAAFVEIHGLPPAWYSVQGVAGADRRRHGLPEVFPAHGDRVFLTYSTTGRGNEPANPSLALLDTTPYGRGEGWQDNPEGCRRRGRPVRRSVGTAGRFPATGGRTPMAKQTGARRVARCRNGPAPVSTPADTLGRHGDHH